jgi:hypothetical protein
MTRHQDFSSDYNTLAASQLQIRSGIAITQRIAKNMSLKGTAEANVAPSQARHFF